MPTSATPPLPPVSFEAIYKAHHDAVFSFLMRHTNNHRDRSLDLTAEVFAQALVKHTAGADVTQALLVTMARRRLIDEIRKIERRARKHLLLVSQDPGHDPAIRVEETDAVRRTLAKLSPLHQYLLIARFMEDRDVPALAADLGRSDHAVRSLLRRAKAAFAEAYSASMEVVS
ncbi:MAG: sigma-70 family RNA polymerase sigma factor [Actinomycetota bacterium]